ncbi:carboxy terminal-processing peptidase [Brumicola nitratireducens]|uniref:Carboxy-terminal protease n=1 Tax=Glaciecola nitratireducens (strain JCM 12485 / KCTC 12276 / FR1064) TaxID=1085623 RepID=G4QHL3_GLANF|nr:carboxy terminal-processing peptidase [Glaciecola nitratireducens]AEP29999.1 carboxy-terminal protease [Glaciecola nitratireducens FR1064]
MQLNLGKSFKKQLIWISVASALVVGVSIAGPSTETADSIPELSQESQHSKSAKRITDHFTRSHYKKIKIDDELSEKVFERYLRSLDVNKNFFLASDITGFEKSKDSFDDAIRQGQLDIAYDIYMVNLKRRAERFNYALTLLDKPFDYEVENDKYFYDREKAVWAATSAELNEVWRQRVKYDALNLKMADKTWEETQDILTKRYKRAIKRLSQTNSEDVFQTVMNSFARSIEAHTSYLSPRNTERFQMEMNLSLEGIGAVLRSEDDHTVIVSLVAGGPADKSAKIKPEDKIIAVAQEGEEFVDIVGWRLDEVVELIKGPKGSVVKLQVLKGSSESKKIAEIQITRDKVKLEDRAAKSEVYIPDSGPHKGQKLGVINIPSFYHNLHVDVKKELDKLKDENVEGVIVDLRGNGGGSLPESVLLSGLFIDKGPVVQVRYENGRISVDRDTDGLVYYGGPLTVMVDRYSASASEIFAAAMQDYNRAVIIGEQTFGKGTVQQHRGLSRIYDLDKTLGAVQFTIAKFYRISGGSTQHKGVLPDILYPSPVDPAEWGESKEENALPYDSIQKANYSQLGRYDGVIDVLAAKHAARVIKDPEFAYIFTDIEEYNKNKDKNYISLVESERLETKKETEEKQLVRINERLERMGLEKVTSLEDELPEALEKIDPFLSEAANITFDMVSSGSYALNLKD